MGAEQSNDPVHEAVHLLFGRSRLEQLEILGMLGPVFVVNVVLDPERRLSFVNFGRIRPSHEEAVVFSERYSHVAVPRTFPVVITSGAGNPLDLTYYQTIKGIVAAG